MNIFIYECARVSFCKVRIKAWVPGSRSWTRWAITTTAAGTAKASHSRPATSSSSGASVLNSDPERCARNSSKTTHFSRTNSKEQQKNLATIALQLIITLSGQTSNRPVIGFFSGLKTSKYYNTHLMLYSKQRHHSDSSTMSNVKTSTFKT